MISAAILALALAQPVVANQGKGLTDGGAWSVNILSMPAAGAATGQGASRDGGIDWPVAAKVTSDGTNVAPVVNTAPGSSDYGLNVRVVSQPAGGAAAAQGTSRDAGTDWPVTAKLTDSNGVAIGTAGAPLRMDPTGSTTQPVTNANLDVALSTRTKPADQQHALLDTGSTTAVTQATGTNLHTVVDNLPGDAGQLAQDSTVGSLLTYGQWSARVATLGRKSMAGSSPVVIAWDQAPVPMYFPTPQAVTLATVPAHQVTALGPDGGTTFDVSGSQLLLANADLPTSQLLTFAEWQARVATLGRKASSGSAPVVLAWDQQPVPSYFPSPQPVVVTSTATASGPDGGSTLDVTGSAVAISGPVYAVVVSAPLNPFRLRCNAVRTTNCQP